MSFLGLGGGDPTGYPTLTPDQSNMLSQQGWYPNPDMVMPDGSSPPATPGYSNLTPAQATTVNQLGYFTNDDAAKQKSMLETIADKLGSPEGQDALKKLQGAVAGPQQQRAAPGQPPIRMPPGYNPLYNIYTARQRNPLDPNLALQRLMQGY